MTVTQLTTAPTETDLAPGVRIVVASPIFPKKAYRGRKETGRAVLFT